ncbi:MAG: TetR/AcrR family transcriptional regulator [Chloroflexi bacterium]|nr:TetR/AcrR family transcriptional regulator [Chloroflexota bacterium]
MVQSDGQVRVQVRERVRNRRRKQERPEEVLAAALAEFVAHGYAATTIEQIARRAGVAKGTVYLYYPSKADLFNAVVRHSIAARFQDLRDTAREFTGTAEQFLRGPFRQLLERFLRSEARGLVRTLVAEAHLFPELSEFYYREVVTPGLEALRLVIARGEASGELRATAAGRLPQVLLAPASLVIIWEALFSRFDALEPDALLDTYLDLLVDGMRARPALC